jgi:hypothetical protein
MYYHPFMFEWANADRTLATCRACVDVWLDGVARHQQAHSEAVSAFNARQLDALRALAAARDAPQFAARLLACADPKALELGALSTRLGGTVAETHRKLGDAVGSHADQARASRIDEAATSDAPRRKAPTRGRDSARRQMMA